MHTLLIILSCHFDIGFKRPLKNTELFSQQAKCAFSCLPCTRKLAIECCFSKIEFLPWKGSHQVWLQGKSLIPTKYNKIIIFVPGMFLIGGMFKSPELNVFPKLESLKTLLSFSRPRAPTSISVKQQFASATPNKFIE
jgi:hypothetical protein